MKNIGMNATHMIAGDANPTDAATTPSDAARLYPGAVEATPMTTLEMNPSAPDFRPFSSAVPGSPRAGGAVTTLSVLIARPRCSTSPGEPNSARPPAQALRPATLTAGP